MPLGGREPPAGNGPAVPGSVLELTHTRRPKELPGGSLAPPSLFLLTPPLLLITKANPRAPGVPSAAAQLRAPSCLCRGPAQGPAPVFLSPRAKGLPSLALSPGGLVCWQNTSLHVPSASRVTAGSGEELFNRRSKI